MVVSSRRSFGSGLSAVLGAVNTGTEEFNEQELKQVMVHQIVSGKYQPRREFDEVSLQELADSIAVQGILQPIVVRKAGQDEYEIIAGERRWRAAQMAGLQRIPVIACDITDESALAFGLIENIQRKDLNPIEEAFALKRLIEEFGLTHEQVAKSIGRSRAVITNTLRLLNLTPAVQRLLINKEIDVGHAKVLMVFSPDEQEKIAATIVEKKLTVRAVERLIQLKKSGKAAFSQVIWHPGCEQWSELLSSKLESTVSVQINQDGGGKVVIQIDSLDEIEWLVDHLKLEQ